LQIAISRFCKLQRLSLLTDCSNLELGPPGYRLPNWPHSVQSMSCQFVINMEAGATSLPARGFYQVSFGSLRWGIRSLHSGCGPVLQRQQRHSHPTPGRKPWAIYSFSAERASLMVRRTPQLKLFDFVGFCFRFEPCRASRLFRRNEVMPKTSRYFHEVQTTAPLPFHLHFFEWEGSGPWIEQSFIC
jgi:hypothetical protein